MKIGSIAELREEDIRVLKMSFSKFEKMADDEIARQIALDIEYHKKWKGTCCLRYGERWLCLYDSVDGIYHKFVVLRDYHEFDDSARC